MQMKKTIKRVQQERLRNATRESERKSIKADMIKGKGLTPSQESAWINS